MLPVFLFECSIIVFIFKKFSVDLF